MATATATTTATEEGTATQAGVMRGPGDIVRRRQELARSRQDPSGTPRPDYRALNDELFAERDHLKGLLTEMGVDLTSIKAVRGAARRPKRRLLEIEEFLVEINMPLVWNYVNRFRSHSSADETEEFIRAGTAGLWSAMANFDPSKGTFANWAYRPIQREVIRCLRMLDYQNMNHCDFEARPKIQRAREEVLAAGEDATIDAVAAQAGVTVGQARAVLEAPTSVALETPLGTDGVSTVADTIASDDTPIDEQVFATWDIEQLERLMSSKLDSREIYVLSRHYGLDGDEPATLAMLGRELGMSREAVRQIERRAFSKLTHPASLRLLIRDA